MTTIIKHRKTRITVKVIRRRLTKTEASGLIRRREQPKEEIEHLHNKLREWHEHNREYKYGDPMAIAEAVLRGSDRANRKIWQGPDILKWYELPVKVKIVDRSKITNNYFRG